MVYNIGSTISLLGAGLSNKYMIAALGNPIFPLIMISLMFIIILGLMVYWSDYSNKWKKFSAFSLITILGTTIILFVNKYFQDKNKNSSASFYGGSTKLPDASYFMPKPTYNSQINDVVAPEASFADLFD